MKGDEIGNSVDALLIAGPTASGKSALAIECARRLGGRIINADSMQVYDILRVLTARPSLEEEALAPHCLYGHVNPAQDYSVAHWISDVKRELREARELGVPVVIVGGTGLYFKALTQGLSPVPEIDPLVRAQLRSRSEEEGAAALHQELAARDAQMAAQLKPGDTQRIVRALEVLMSTGRSLRYWQSQPGVALLEPKACKRVVLAPDRAWLHQRIERRFAMMMAQGAMEEALALAKLGLNKDKTSMRAIGVIQLVAAAENRMSLADAIERAVIETRQYAKRQETFFRGQLKGWPRVLVGPNEKSPFAQLKRAEINKF